VTTIESNSWDSIVKDLLPQDPTESLSKKQQQGLADALQEWAAHCITLRLYEILHDKDLDDTAAYVRAREEWQIHHKGRLLLGALRRQEVDDWLSNPEAGLVLAVDPKHFQSQDSLRKNWKNGLNDLVAFATNFHERFPLCAVGGVISFPEWAAASRDLQQMYSICSRVISREKASNAHGKFEGFALAVYNIEGKLIWPFSEPESPLKPEVAFTALANAVYIRTISLL